ncbi:MAG: DNA gyrase/topoisomerase IV subunit A [Bacteroidales bacterium]|nr:DNA gyrase/topoisomerase IV subunit A [Bacteroidales bacterium]MBN2818194.1 DNA gyrase/topoisomerase IV subunit A [Bacteroidales bacterium]
MSLDDIDKKDELEDSEEAAIEPEIVEHQKSTHVTKLSGMYREWFLDYASYVILERAVPHINDGLKPVQRRILHSMRRLDDGRYNKVANIIGHTMQFHPHGDASIGDALVQIGQKDLLVDTQGNWGNILTGDGAAASRYIEARLSKFALDVVFNPKTTSWKASYDGRNKEPIALPVKFPLLLAQGAEGIAVGLASKILPHNFIELIDASIAYLEGKPFELYPDFPTGGMVDVSKYNDGLRGGNIRVRAKIVKVDSKTLSIIEIPFGKTTSTVIESIIKANEKEKIKIKKIDDNTAQHVEILIHLAPGISPDVTIDALYAFTDCEISISPNNCVIQDDKPRFLGVTEMLKHSADKALEMLKMELEIRLSELESEWHKSSLEKIFITERMYKKPGYENADSRESALKFLDKEFEPFKKLFRRDITMDDLAQLFEIKMGRILKFNALKADEEIKGLETEMDEVKNHLANIVAYTINYFKQIKKKYGKGKERLTEIRSFDTIEAVQVAVANEKLYMNREEGFIGTSMKKEEYVCDCSDIDDIIVIRRDGKYLISKVAEKLFVGKDILFAGVFKRNDNRTTYNIVYRDGLNGALMAKRCAITGLTRDKEYDLTKGTKGSKILHLSVNPNGEAEILKITFKPRPRLRNLHVEYDFSELAIKGKNSQGNILTKYAIHRIEMKEAGESTLGGLKIWLDEDVQRLNTDGRGKLLGEFKSKDRIIAFYNMGYHCTYKPDVTTHFDEGMVRIEKFDENKIYTLVYFDTELKFHYIKRFVVEALDKAMPLLPEDTKAELVAIYDTKYPRVKIEFGGKYKDREDEIIDVDEFIAVKGFRAKGKRISNYTVKHVTEIEPAVKDEEPKDIDPDNGNNDTGDKEQSSNGFEPKGGYSGEQMSLDLS